MQIIKVPEFKFTEYKPLSYGIGKEKESNAPQCFEDMDMGWGTIVYETQVPAIESTSTLTGEFHDFAQVYVNGKYVGTIDRVKNEKSLELPAMPQGAQLTIVVEGMGRINFGRAIKDYKGIIGNVTLTTQKRIANLPSPLPVGTTAALLMITRLQSRHSPCQPTRCAVSRPRRVTIAATST